MTRQNIDIIQSYLEGTLSDSELARFKDRIKTDLEFREEFFLHKAMQTALGERDRAKSRSEIEPFLNHVPKRRFGRIYYIAATITLVLGIAYLSVIDRNDIGEEYFQPYAGPPITRGETEVTPGILEYKKQNYPVAITNLKLESEELDDPSEHFLMIGSAYFQQAELDSALHYFSLASESKVKMIQDHASWYKGLTLIQLNQKREGIVEIRKLIDSSLIYKNFALKFLEELD